MTAKQFFNNLLSTDASCPVDVYAHKYDREDLFRFAEAYAKSKQIKLKEELQKYEIYDKGFVWVEEHKDFINNSIDEYLKTRNNGVI
jgi:hypothetical protein